MVITCGGANIENKSGRGCLLYAKIKLGAKEILLKKLYNEYVLIEITCKGRDEKILVCCIYRSPNSSLENNATLCDCITELSKITPERPGIEILIKKHFW